MLTVDGTLLTHVTQHSNFNSASHFLRRTAIVKQQINYAERWSYGFKTAEGCRARIKMEYLLKNVLRKPAIQLGRFKYSPFIWPVSHSSSLETKMERFKCSHLQLPFFKSSVPVACNLQLILVGFFDTTLNILRLSQSANDQTRAEKSLPLPMSLLRSVPLHLPDQRPWTRITLFDPRTSVPVEAWITFHMLQHPILTPSLTAAKAKRCSAR